MSPGESLGAQAQEALPGKADAEGWRHLHPLSPILRGGLAFVIIIGVIIANLRDRLINIFVAGEASDFTEGDVLSLFEFLDEGGWLLAAIGGLILVIVLIVVLSWVVWKFQTYRVTGDAVEARSGVLFKQHRRAPLDRVQSVNLQRSLLARALGLTKVEVHTGGQGGKVELSYLGYRDAKTAREQILRLAAARRAGIDLGASIDEISGALPVSFDGSALAPAQDKLTERAQDFVDLDIDPEATANQTLLRVPVARLAGSIALSWEAIFLVLTIVVAIGWGTISALLGWFGGAREGLGAGAVSLLTLIPLVLVFVSVMFSQFNKGFNFTLSRGRDSVRIGAGLTATVNDSIPFGRIHAIEARQPLLWRPFGWWKVRVTLAGHSVAQGGQNNLQNVVLPVGPEVDVLRVIDVLVPGIGADLRDGLSGPGAQYIGAGRRAGWVLWFGRKRAGIRIAAEPPAEAAAPVDAFGSDSAQASDAEPVEATLRIRRGFLTRSLIVMPIVRAQSIQLYRPLVHRMLGLAQLQAHTVLGPITVQMRGLALEQARDTFDDLEAAILRVQGADSSGLNS